MVRIGELVWWRERPYFLRGVGPMGVSDRTAEIEGQDDGKRITVPYDEVRADPNPAPDELTAH